VKRSSLWARHVRSQSGEQWEKAGSI
jgi:hypothetical protein